MNNVILIGRITRDIDVRESQSGVKYARYTLAVDRRVKKDDQPATDFPVCVVIGKGAEFAEKYLKKGMKIAVTGHLQTGSYTNKDNQKVYTTDVVVENQEFCESKKASEDFASDEATASESNGVEADSFMEIPEGIEDEIPFA